MKFHGIIAGLLLLLPAGIAEFAAHRWMNPAKSETSRPYPLFAPPLANAAFTAFPSEYADVEDQLQCNGGWMGNLGDGTTPVIRLAWFEWDDTSTVSTLEAFQHLPEACMGAAGMKLEKIHAPRVSGEGEKRLVFDSTRFRPVRGEQAIHVFKSVWVAGWAGADLRSNALDGASFGSLRALRFAAAKHRFRPERTRVLMATVTGFPTEELAWGWFKNQSLSKLRWSDEPAAPGT